MPELEWVELAWVNPSIPVVTAVSTKWWDALWHFASSILRIYLNTGHKPSKQGTGERYKGKVKERGSEFLKYHVPIINTWQFLNRSADRQVIWRDRSAAISCLIPSPSSYFLHISSSLSFHTLNFWPLFFFPSHLPFSFLRSTSLFHHSRKEFYLSDFLETEKQLKRQRRKRLFSPWHLLTCLCLVISKQTYTKTDIHSWYTYG